MNTVILVGRVGSDPDMKHHESGVIGTTFNIAVSRWERGAEKTDWWKIQLWEKQAETAAEYVKKGALVGVEGRFDINCWTDKEGNHRESSVIQAHHYRLLSAKKKEEINE